MDFDLRESKFANAINNANHFADFKYVKKYIRGFLGVLGVWPFVSTQSSRLQRNFAKIIIPCVSLFMITLPFPVLVHLIVRKPDSSTFFFTISPVVFQISDITSHYLMVLRSGAIKVCMQHMEKDWRRVSDSADRDIMMKNLKSGNTLTIFCVTLLYTNVVTYRIVLPLISARPLDEFNQTLKPLQFPGVDIFFDPQQSGLYELAFGTTVVAGFIHYSVKCTVVVLGILMVGHTCGQSQIIVRKIENLVQETEAENQGKAVVKPIEAIVQNHVRLLQFSNTVESAMREILLVEVSGMTLMVCLAEYCFITKFGNGDSTALITYGVWSCTFMSYIFLFCRMGELLTEQCLQIGTTAYNIEWYKLPKETIVALDLIMIMGTCPRRITAGGMMDLSLMNFAATIKTSFAYLNMLRTVT